VAHIILFKFIVLLRRKPNGRYPELKSNTQKAVMAVLDRIRRTRDVSVYWSSIILGFQAFPRRVGTDLRVGCEIRLGSHPSSILSKEFVNEAQTRDGVIFTAFIVEIVV